MDTEERSESGEGFSVGTSLATDEIVVRLNPELAHRVGALIWRALANQRVDDPRVVLSAALCNLAEYMQQQPAKAG